MENKYIDLINKYTIDDICEEIMLAEQNSFKGESPLLLQLMESQGIVDEYYSIAKELYNAILNVEKMPYDQDYSYLIYRLNDYTLKQDCFIKTVNVSVLARKKGYKYHGSYFERDYDNVEISSDFKLLNANFVIGINENNLNTLESENVFLRQMSHEIHHAFRFYNICISNNASIEKAKISSERYGNMINVMRNMSSSDSDMRFLAPKMYMLDKNEIISEANELYEFIRQHEEIKPNNFGEMVKDLPLFWRISRAAELLKFLDKTLFIEKDEEKINKIGNAYIKLMNFKNITPHKAFVKCRCKVIGMEEYIRNVFFRTVQKAFDDFNRKREDYSFNIKEYIERDDNFNLLREILNKN